MPNPDYCGPDCLLRLPYHAWMTRPIGDPHGDCPSRDPDFAPPSQVMRDHIIRKSDAFACSVASVALVLALGSLLTLAALSIRYPSFTTDIGNFMNLAPLVAPAHKTFGENRCAEGILDPDGRLTRLRIIPCKGKP